MTDVDSFAPTGVELGGEPLHLVEGPQRGDEFENASPAEALAELTARTRSPLLLTEGLHWVLQQPEVLERGHCFMTIGSRRATPRGAVDARTPALRISDGTGRDGRERKDAPKLGWCWWNNRTPGSASPPPRGAARCDSRPSCAGGLCQERRSCRAPWTIVTARKIRIAGARSTVMSRNGRWKIAATPATRTAIATR